MLVMELCCNKPDKFTGFSRTVFLVEVQNFCPVVYYLVLDGIQESNVKIKGTAVNSVTLASAINVYCTTGFPPYCRAHD